LRSPRTWEIAQWVTAAVVGAAAFIVFKGKGPVPRVLISWNETEPVPSKRLVCELRLGGC
jgi:hypothetical protein